MSGTATKPAIDRERRTGDSPVTTVTINRSTVLGRQYRTHQSHLPTMTATIDVPPALVEAARELYTYYHEAPEGRQPAKQPFAEYLHDIVMDRIQLELRYPGNEGPG